MDDNAPKSSPLLMPDTERRRKHFHHKVMLAGCRLYSQNVIWNNIVPSGVMVMRADLFLWFHRSSISIFWQSGGHISAGYRVDGWLLINCHWHWTQSSFVLSLQSQLQSSLILTPPYLCTISILLTYLKVSGSTMSLCGIVLSLTKIPREFITMLSFPLDPAVQSCDPHKYS